MGEWGIPFLSDREFRILGESVVVSLWVTFFVSICSFVYGIYALLHRGRLAQLIQKIILVPLFIPPYFHALSWINALQWLAYKNSIPWITLSTVVAFRSHEGLIFILVLSFLPVALLLIHSSVGQIDRTAVLTGLSHQSFMKVVWRIILPQLMPSMYATAGIIFAFSFITFDVPSLLEVPGYTAEIFSVISVKFDISKAFVMSLIPMIITLIGSYGMMKIFPRRAYEHDVKDDSGGYSPVWFRSVVYGFLLLYGLVSVILPLMTIVLGTSISKVSLDTLQSDWFPPMRSTLFLCFWGAVMSVTVSWLLKDIWEKHQFIRLFFLSSLLLSPMFLGMLVIYVTRLPILHNVNLGVLSLLIAYTLRTFPVTSELLHQLREKISPEVYAVFELVPNVSRLNQLWWEIRLLFPILLVTIYVSFWFIATEIPLTILLQPPDFQTVMARIYILLHYGSLSYMNLMMLCTLATLIIPLVGIVLLRKLFVRNHE